MFVFHTSAADPIRFHQLAPDQGLIPGIVNAVAQDADGLIWIGTQHGLTRFDGYEFDHHFHLPEDATSLPGDLIRALLLDRGGRLWIGTDGGGLAWYDPVERRFHRETQARNVRALAQTADGALWVATDGQGLIRLDPGAMETQTFGTGEAGLTSPRIKALQSDGSLLWVGTDGGGLFRSDGSGQFLQVEGIPANARIRTLAGGGGTHLWVGTYDVGVFRLALAGGAIDRFRADAAGPLSSDSVRALWVDTDQNLWIGYENAGLQRIGPDGQVSLLRHDPSNRFSLIDDQVSALFQDDGGVIWVGTQAGLSRWNPAFARFTSFSSTGENGLPDGWVAAFDEGSDGTLWVASLGGVVGVDVETGDMRPLWNDALDTGQPSDPRVLAVLEDRLGRVWSGTRASGLDRYDPQTRTWENFRHDPALSSSLSGDGVTSILEDSRGRIWVATYSAGLNLWNEVDASFRSFSDNVPPGCASRVLSIYEDRSGLIWLGTHGGGLCRLEPETGRVSLFTHDREDAASLSSDSAWYVMEDEHSNLWIATGDRGLSVWLAEDRAVERAVFLRFGIGDGLPSLTIYGLSADADGGVWLSSNKGLTRVELNVAERNLQQVRHFSGSDGLPSDEFNFAAVGRTRAGELLFGSTAGFTVFDPGSVSSNRYEPDVVLTRIAKLNKSVPVAGLVDSVVLDHTENLLTFEYAATDFTAPWRAQFMHRLEGFEEAWVEDGNRRRATYTNLAPGEYVFRARATNSDGLWSGSELTVPITVLPAPWATPWAYAIYALVLLALAFVIYRDWAARVSLARQLGETNALLTDEIEERKGKEVALEESMQTAQRYLDVVEVIILAITRDGTVTMINQKGARVIGLSEAEIVGENFYERFVPVSEAEQIEAGVESLDQYAYSESNLVTADGETRLIAWHTITLPDEGGGVLMSGTDVTQMRLLETQLRESKMLEALGTLARGVAHDFNNILSAILGYAESPR